MLNPQQLTADLFKLTAGRPICLAYSGGIDSHVLLHVLATVPSASAVRAIHINHGIHPDASNWANHCQYIAESLGIDFSIIEVTLEQVSEIGVEAAARRARYRALNQALSANEVLVTAQHQNDQAETFLLQLLRGAGPKGLSAMPEVGELEGMRVIRPLLTVTQQSIIAYAQHHKLRWIDDPSNQNTHFNRNYIRHRVWPILDERWPMATQLISRSASHCNEAVSLMADLAAIDEKTCSINNQRLSINALKKLSEERQRNLLRFCIEKQKLTLPSTLVLQRIIDEVIGAAEDAEPFVTWQGAEVRRYRDELYIQAPNPNLREMHSQTITDTQTKRLNASSQLIWTSTYGKGLSDAVISAGLSLRFREGGERIRIDGHSHHKSLKHLFQEWAVPPWQRDHIPLLFAGDELVAVVGYAYADGYAVDNGGTGWIAQLFTDS
ncbi:MAG TPA: tRNA lysidine(34) synthetase TilS [Methylophaga aminisulfidivorans]|uniref:tRNA(Ile)-lysidine synthase n=2 Tax=root TaxID=1 RepID=A0A7C1W5V7_9GAMM|nr:tRNA lysidine(34) synthetase TilS [Methylophaga aminisulfidivorans]